MFTQTRAERRRSYRDHQAAQKPSQPVCARTKCGRTITRKNPYGVCPRCLEIAETIKWLVTSGVLKPGAQKSALEEIGLSDPNKRSG